jgi:hypothetical protein
MRLCSPTQIPHRSLPASCFALRRDRTFALRNDSIKSVILRSFYTSRCHPEERQRRGIWAGEISMRLCSPTQILRRRYAAPQDDSGGAEQRRRRAGIAARRGPRASIVVRFLCGSVPLWFGPQRFCVDPRYLRFLVRARGPSAQRAARLRGDCGVRGAQRAARLRIEDLRQGSAVGAARLPAVLRLGGRRACATSKLSSG